MVKRSIIVLVILVATILTTCLIRGKASGIVGDVKNAIENWASHVFLENRGILQDETDESVTIENFLICAQNDDVDSMMSLFAPAAIMEVGKDELKNMLTSFVEYYNGELVTVEMLFGAATDESILDGKKSKVIRAPFDITTSANEYRLAAKIVECDDWTPDNIGIWSLYIIDRAEDTNVEQPYRGDLSYSTGVYVGVARPR